jgi:hypothetical protein
MRQATRLARTQVISSGRRPARLSRAHLSSRGRAHASDAGLEPLPLIWLIWLMNSMVIGLGGVPQRCLGVGGVWRRQGGLDF